MKTYLVNDDSKVKLIQVPPELDEAFHDRYDGKILIAGDSVQDVLLRFGQSPVIIESPA